MTRVFRVSVIVAILLAGLAWPNHANAAVADVLVLLKTITSTLRSDIGLVLGTMRTTKAAVNRLEQVVVWPREVINQARGMAASLRAQYSGLAHRIYRLPLNSATLPAPVELESIIRGGQVRDLAQISLKYSQVYPSVPAAGSARASDRNVIDAADATAVASLKAAVAADQSNQSTLSVADVLERQSAATAPGAAPLLLAQAQATELENQAVLHRLLATELREEAARLAHQNTLRKRHVEANGSLRIQLQQVLTR